MKKLLYLLLAIILLGCAKEEESLISEKLSSMTLDKEMYWSNYSNCSTCEDECVYKFFQNGHIYSEQCTQRLRGSDPCLQKVYNSWALDEISILSETSDKMIFVYRNETMEIRLNGNTVRIVYNNNPDYDFSMTKIAGNKALEFQQEWLSFPRCN